MIKGRPEWIKCIQRMHNHMTHLTWCGREHYDLEFLFLGVDHAAENGASGGRLVACRQCVGAIREALNANRDSRPGKPLGIPG